MASGKIATKSHNSDGFLQSEHRIKEIAIHENFSALTFENDIAMIFLKTTVNQTTFVRIAKLPFTKFENQSLKFSGRALMKKERQMVYQHFPMKLESSELCKQLFKALGSRNFVGKFQVSNT